ncbi:hypothetical protein [Clostridium lacusfryxellense]|uniref:hypothetical protein n=1 Tax=Clostridium lacusfryxellense TaxID=205328 RepID=UPI001FEC2D99|nr:hypothetical protein [Clostridium lacusfryxellense]
MHYCFRTEYFKKCGGLRTAKLVLWMTAEEIKSEIVYVKRRKIWSQQIYLSAGSISLVY